MTYRLKRKTENWRQRLPRPLRLRSGKTLTTLADCRAYCLELDEYEATRPAWQRTAALLIEAAETGKLEAVNRQFETILLHQNKTILPAG